MICKILASAEGSGAVDHRLKGQGYSDEERESIIAAATAWIHQGWDLGEFVRSRGLHYVTVRGWLDERDGFPDKVKRRAPKDEDGQDDHGVTDDDLPDYMMEKIRSRVINGRPLTQRGFAAFAGIHQTIISNINTGSMYRQGNLRERILDALDRMDAATDDEIIHAIKTQPRPELPPELQQWASDIKARLAKTKTTYLNLAKQVERDKSTLVNITAMRYAPSPVLKSMIDNALTRIEQDHFKRVADRG